MAKKTASPPKIEAVDKHTKYEFEYAPGESISLRVLSHRERDRLMNGRLALAGLFVARLANWRMATFSNEITELTVTSAEMQRRYDEVFAEVYPIVEMIGLDNAAAIVSEWTDYGDANLLTMLFYRILGVESALSTGKELPEMTRYPTAAEVLALDEDGADELGEDLPPSIPPSGTLPSDAPAATSSDGAAITTG